MSLHRVAHLLRAGAAGDTKGPLLFVSDSTAAVVYIYQLSTVKVVNTVTGLTDPQGECADTKGDVWVTDAGVDSIYELSHQGRLENTLTAAGYPVGCAWDRTPGNLAVMSLFGSGSGSGSHGAVTVYAKRGSSHQYQNPTQYYYNFGGYDTSGDLLFDGRSESGAFMLSELPKGAKTALTIAIGGGTIYYPGMVQWDTTSKELIVGDQSCGGIYTASCLYAIQIANEAGTIESTIDLQNSRGGQICDLIQGVIYKGKLAGSDNDICGSSPSTTYVWPYPAGGAPTLSNSSTDSTPVGAAVSP
ncbi:MAG: hypothetical protein WBX26_09445 [Candidatus Cybelea sp.]